MWSLAENHISLSCYEPPSELLWKHSRVFRVKKEQDVPVYETTGKIRWYRGNMRFRPLK